jgi:hypothetical protein
MFAAGMFMRVLRSLNRIALILALEGFSGGLGFLIGA